MALRKPTAAADAAKEAAQEFRSAPERRAAQRHRRGRKPRRRAAKRDKIAGRQSGAARLLVQRRRPGDAACHRGRGFAHGRRARCTVRGRARRASKRWAPIRRQSHALEPFAAHGLIGTAELGRELDGANAGARSGALEPAPSNTSLLADDRKPRAKARPHHPGRPVGSAGGRRSGGRDRRGSTRMPPRGDIDAALAEIAKLPDETRAPAASVGQQGRPHARRRLPTSRRIAAEALTALAKPEPR